MKISEILKQFNSIVIDILDDEDIILTPSTTANDVDEWDSLANIQIVVALEKKFEIRFTAKEIQSWKNVGEMVQSTAAKL